MTYQAVNNLRFVLIFFLSLHSGSLLGLRRQNNSSPWKWASDGEEASAEMTPMSQPDGGGPFDCADYHKDNTPKKVVEVNCQGRLSFVCQRC